MPARLVIVAAVTALGALPLPAALAASSGPAAGAGCVGADDPPTAATARQAAQAVLCLVNAERAARSLPALRAERHLGRAARAYAAQLLAGRPGAASSSPRDRIAAAGYAGGNPRGFAFGEALGRGGITTPAERVRGWLRSSATRRLVLSHSLRDAGVGVRVAKARAVFVLDLAARAPRKR